MIKWIVLPVLAAIVSLALAEIVIRTPRLAKVLGWIAAIIALLGFLHALDNGLLYKLADSLDDDW
jgi:hypothetical protein